MTATTFAVHTATPGHMRPLSVFRDLPAVADLIELCFASTMDPDGRSYVDQMRRSGRDSHFLNWASRMIDSTSLPLSGYIWEDGGKVVGNVSLIPFPRQGRKIYLIANVATHPDFRRRGIARILTDAAVQRAREKRAASIWLHVREENTGALKLYHDLGFQERARRTSWHAPSGTTPLGNLRSAISVMPRPTRDWAAQHTWLEQAYPPMLHWYNQASWDICRSEANRALKSDAMTSVLNSLGSAGAADYFDYLGEQPKKYFSAGVLDGSANISGSTVAETILVGKAACHACVVACGRVVRLADGEKRKGPEYETLVGFGPNLGLTDASTATRLGELCDRYGVDVISMSGTIGLAFKLFEMGKITVVDTGGLELSWGSAEAAAQCIHLAVRREGFGRWLALGSRGLGRHFGAEEAAVQVNGLEVAYHDPRGASGMALVYATSPRGACHNQSDYFLADIGQVDSSLGLEFFDRHAGAEKAANVARHQDFRAVNNALVLCIFANVPPETMVGLVNAACGYNLTLDDLMRCGERAWNLKRLINLRLGLTRANDTLPAPLLRPYADGGAADYVIPFDQMMSAYYAARGWDAETGRPNMKKLLELGLNWVAKEL